jgi:hypothetical protein
MSRGEPLDEDLWGSNPVDLERQLIKEKTNGKTTKQKIFWNANSFRK